MNKFERLFNINKRIFWFYSLLLRAKRIPLSIRTKQSLKNNLELEHQKKSDVCFVVGLGPSLSAVDLEALDGDLIVTNRYFRVQNANKTKPFLYILMDSAFYHDDCSMTEAMKMFPETNFILNGLYYRYTKNHFNFDSNKIWYVNMWGSFFSSTHRLNMTKLMPMSNNIICSAIMIALCLGYKKIILIGCDFNSFASLKPIHVYKEDSEKRLWSLSDELFQYSFSADTHVQLEKYSKKHNIAILNASENSLIDAYEKVSIDLFYGKNDKHNGKA